MGALSALDIAGEHFGVPVYSLLGGQVWASAALFGVDVAALRAGGVTDVDTVTLGRLLEALPCCVLGPDGETLGNPFNLVVIEGGKLAYLPFIRHRRQRRRSRREWERQGGRLRERAY